MPNLLAAPPLVFCHEPAARPEVARLRSHHAPAPARMSPAAATPDPAATARHAEDAALLARLVAGDTQALSELYDRHHRPLYALARRILNDSAEAEDILHDVFLSIWQNAATYDTARGTLFTWAATLTRNRAIDRLRRRQNRQQLLDQAHPADLAPAAPPSADPFLDREKSAMVRQALHQLGSDQSQALELAYFQGLTHEEIASRLQQPLGTIKARIRRGLLKLRDLLAPQP